MNQFGVLETVLREYAAHGDSVLLANFIHTLLSTIQGDHDRYLLSSTRILPSISGGNIVTYREVFGFYTQGAGRQAGRRTVPQSKEALLLNCAAAARVYNLELRASLSFSPLSTFPLAKLVLRGLKWV